MRPFRDDRVRAIGSVLVAAQFMPLTIWAGNRAEIGFPDGLLVWVLLVAGVGSLLWLVLRRLGLEAPGATTVAFWAVMGASILGLRSEATPGGLVTLSALLLAFCVLIYRLRWLRPLQWFHSWAVLFVALSPATFVVHSYFGGVAQATPDVVESVETRFLHHPDVVLAVFDAHASLDVLDEHFGVDVSSQYATWRSHGAQVATDMKANYALTHLSLASVLEMGYPYGAGARIREGDWDHLLGIVSGSNALIDTFKAQGYRYTIVESGWSGLHCDDVADSCVKGTWPDQGTRLAMERSMAKPVFQSVLKDGESIGALHSMRWLEEGLPRLLGNEYPDLVLVHLMLPHPPLRLDADCRYRAETGLGGTTLASPWFTDEEIDKRIAGYLDATECARDVISKLLEVLGSDGILVALGDHGPDSRAQLFRDLEDWSMDELEERFGALFVTNSRCPTEGFHSLVNLGRWLIGCLAQERPSYLEDRFFLGGNAQRNVGANPEPMLEVSEALRGGGS